MMQGALNYQTGFANEFATEAVAGALPQGRYSPQRDPFELYAELISGTAFAARRAENWRTWVSTGASPRWSPARISPMSRGGG